MNTFEHRELGDERLAALWSAEGDVLARDLLLLRRWRTGDNDAGTALLAHYTGLFHRICLRCGVRRDEDVREVFQEVVLRLITRLHELPERVERSFAGFFAWQIRDAAGRWRRRSARESALEEDEVADRAGLAGGLSGVDAWDAIQHCWDKLPPREHKVFELRYLRGLSLRETADALQSNENAVGQNLFRLSRKMRECLERSGF